MLQEEVLAILTIGLSQQIRLEPGWIPREENEFADYLSRLCESDDWMLNPEFFQELDASGVRIPLICLLMCTIPNYKGSTLVIGVLALRQ